MRLVHLDPKSIADAVDEAIAEAIAGLGGGGGMSVLAFGSWNDSAGSSLAVDSSTPLTWTGDNDATLFDIDSGNVRGLVDGVLYLAHFSGVVQGADEGDEFEIELQNGGGAGGMGHDQATANALGVANWGFPCAPAVPSGTPAPFFTSIVMRAGTGAGYVASARLDIIALGVAP